jgi:hypothetical protein
MGWFHKITHGISSGVHTITNGAKEAAEEAARKSREAAEAAARKAKEAADEAAEKAKEAAEAAKEAAEKTGNSFVHAANAASHAAVSAWTATSTEAQAVGSAVEGAGITIGNGFIQGATVVGNGLTEGAEKVEEGLVALGEYVTEHACDIALGSALSAAFVTLAADGEEEASVGELAALAATNFADQAALNTASKALAFIIVEPVYAIPGVSKAGHKSLVEAVIAFLIKKACSEKPKLVVGSGGQFIAGVLIYGITSFVCEGTVPGGFKAWHGVQG